MPSQLTEKEERFFQTCLSLGLGAWVKTFKTDNTITYWYPTPGFFVVYDKWGMRSKILVRIKTIKKNDT